MHFLMAAIGSAGDVFPFIAVGQALARRGHRVDVQASPWFEDTIRAAGLGFVAAGSAGDYERLAAQPELWHPRRGFELLLDQLGAGLLATRSAALAHCSPQTVLVGSTLAWHLRLLQEQQGFRAVTVHLSPSCIFSAEAPAVLPGQIDLAWLPARGVRWVQRLGERWVLDPMIAARLDPIRTALGLPPVREVMSGWQHAPALVIAAWPAWFAPAQADWPAQAVTTGFPQWDRSAAAPLPAALERFLQAGPAPIGITPGSAMAHGRRFFAAAAAACSALGQRMVLITPYADQLPSPLPTGAFHIARVPFEQLVPRLAALAHHGGIGTCAQAFAAGVPQVISPFAHDQFDNAARVQRLGAGRSLRPAAGASAWKKALGAVTTDPLIAMQCRSIATRMAAAGNGAAHIADRLEAFACAKSASTGR